MNNPFDYIPDEECNEAFRKLTVRLEILRESELPEDINFCRHIESGCMLGVLIASDAEGRRHVLYAFSGQLGKAGFHYPGFVGPVFDYLSPEGYFKSREREISRQNREIDSFEENVLVKAKGDYEREKSRLEKEVEAYREICRKSKLARDARRKSGGHTKEDDAAMIRQSQFEKAELHRLKRRVSESLSPYAATLCEAQAHLDALKGKRKTDSEALQEWLFSNFRLLNARGERKSLSEIFADTPMGIPPSGAGECCAPKLLQAAYLKGLTPVSMAEYWYGEPKDGTVRIHGNHYPACRGRCLPVLRWMLQGLPVEPPVDGGNHVEVEHEPEIVF